jgi:RNA polymerase-binding protein DksA
MQKDKTNRIELTAAEIRRFRALLLAKRAEIFKNVTRMEDGTLRRQMSDLSNLPTHMADIGTDNYDWTLRRQMSDLSNLPTHMADIGTDNYDWDFTLGLVDSERKLIMEIDSALDRIENGTYGICEGSSKPIPKARLKAIPWARYCVEYAQLLEKGLVRKEHASDESDRDSQADQEQDEDSE